MLLSVFRYIKGYLKIRVIGYSPERFLNACSYHGIYLWGIAPVCGAYDMYVSIAGFRRLRPILKKTGSKVVITERIGLPFLLFRCRKRKMFVAGAVFGMVLIYILSLFVWDIEIRGNQKYTDEALIAFLDEQGVSHGMRLSQVDCGRIVKDIRKSYDEIIWVSASVEGCRLIIQVKENEDSPDVVRVQGSEGQGQDIVADCDGVITEMIVRKGIPCVGEGQQVTKGQKLVSGAVPVVDDSGEITGYQFQNSDADIRAQISIDYQDSCDLEYEYKEYLLQKQEDWYFRFGTYLFSLGVHGDPSQQSEELTIVHQLHIGDDFFLPVFWGLRVRSPYVTETRTYEKTEIQTMLSEQYGRFTEDLRKKGVEIIENDVKIYTGPAQAEARGTLTVIADIGTEQPASIAEDITDGND